MYWLRISCLALIAGAVPFASADACNIDDPIEIIQGQVGDFSKVRAVVLAKVIGVAPSPVPQAFSGFADLNWVATFEVEKVLRGPVDQARFERRQGGGPGHCDNRRAPAIGALRVLYIFDGGRVYDIDPRMVQLDKPDIPLKAPYSVPY